MSISLLSYKIVTLPLSRSPLIKMQIWKTLVGALERYVRSRAMFVLRWRERRKRIYERVYINWTPSALSKICVRKIVGKGFDSWRARMTLPPFLHVEPHGMLERFYSETRTKPRMTVQKMFEPRRFLNDSQLRSKYGLRAFQFKTQDSHFHHRRRSDASTNNQDPSHIFIQHVRS